MIETEKQHSSTMQQGLILCSRNCIYLLQKRTLHYMDITAPLLMKINNVSPVFHRQIV